MAYSIEGSKEISIFDLINKKIAISLKGHSDKVVKIKYYYDFKRKIEILLSVSYDKSLKLWNISNNYSNILTIANSNKASYYSPSYLIFDVDEYFIMTSDYCEKLKCYTSTDELKLTFNCDYIYNYFTETFYYDNKIYIIIAGIPGIYSYDWYLKKIHKHFLSQDNDYVAHQCLGINIVKKQNEKFVELIECDNNCKINIWDFFNGNLKRTLSCKAKNVMNIWNQKFLFLDRTNL